MQYFTLKCEATEHFLYLAFASQPKQASWKKIHLNILPRIFFNVSGVLGYSLSPELILPLFSTRAMCSGMFDSLWLHGLQSTRLLCTWGFSRQEYWSGLPCAPPGELPSPRIEPGSPALQVDSYQLSYKGSPGILEWAAYPFSSGSSRSRNWTRVSCIAGGFFTIWATRKAVAIL